MSKMGFFSEKKSFFVKTYINICFYSVLRNQHYGTLEDANEGYGEREL